MTPLKRIPSRSRSLRLRLGALGAAALVLPLACGVNPQPTDYGDDYEDITFLTVVEPSPLFSAATKACLLFSSPDPLVISASHSVQLAATATRWPKSALPSLTSWRTRGNHVLWPCGRGPPSRTDAPMGIATTRAVVYGSVLVLVTIVYLVAGTWLIANANLILHYTYDLFALLVAYLLFRRRAHRLLSEPG